MIMQKRFLQKCYEIFYFQSGSEGWPLYYFISTSFTGFSNCILAIPNVICDFLCLICTFSDHEPPLAVLMEMDEIIRNLSKFIALYLLNFDSTYFQ